MCDYLVYSPRSQEFNQNQLEVDPNYQNDSAMPSKIIYMQDPAQMGGFCFVKPEKKKRSSGDSRKSKKSSTSKKSSKSDSTVKSGSTSAMSSKSEWSSSVPVTTSSSSRKSSSTSRHTLEGKKTYTLIPTQAVNWKNCQPIYLNCEQFQEISQSTDCESVQRPVKFSKYPCYQSTDPNRHLVDPKELNLCEQNVECEPPKASKPVYQFRCKKVSFRSIYF